MRRIDSVSDRRIRDIKHAKVLDKQRLEITFNNGATMILCASSEEYGYDAGIYIEKEATTEGEREYAR